MLSLNFTGGGGGGGGGEEEKPVGGRVTDSHVPEVGDILYKFLSYALGGVYG